MTQPNADEVLARAATLETKMDDLRDALESVEESEKTNRILVVGVIIVSALSVIAIIVAIVFAVQANHAGNDAKRAVSQANINKTTQIATCLSSNDSRRVAKQLWDFVLLAAAHGTPPPNAETKKELAQFQRMVNSAYAPRDCSPGGVASSKPPPSK